MLDGMFTCRGGEDLSGGTLDVRCELGVERGSLNAAARLGSKGLCLLLFQLPLGVSLTGPTLKRDAPYFTSF